MHGDCFTEVLVVLLTDPRHLLLETPKFILEVLKLILQDVQLSGLLAQHLHHVVGLEKPSSVKRLANQDIAKEAP